MVERGLRVRTGTGGRQLLLRGLSHFIWLPLKSRVASGWPLADLPGLPPPQGLSRCHMASRERLTIIPHGVPYMTQLLRYFVTEDSIFLHLEHVQGEQAPGALSAPQAFGRLSCLIPLKCRAW